MQRSPKCSGLSFSIQNLNDGDSTVPSCKPFTNLEATDVEDAFIESRTPSQTAAPSVSDSVPRRSDGPATGFDLFVPDIHETEEGSGLAQVCVAL